MIKISKRLYRAELDNRGNILDALKDSEMYQSQLTDIISKNEHRYLNTQVTKLRHEIRHTNTSQYRAGIEKVHRIEAINLAKIALENILHVADDIDYLKGYYKKFLCDYSTHTIGNDKKAQEVTEFDARMGYSFALIDLVIAYMGKKSKGVVDKDIIKNATEAKQQLIVARKKLADLKKDEITDNNEYLVSSYQKLNDLRKDLITKFHKLDGRQRK